MSQPAAALYRHLFLIGFFAPIFSISSAQADWITEPELREACEAFVAKPYSPEGTSCLAFVQGFLLGTNRVAVTEDGDIQAKTPAGNETYVERAVRTRLGDSHLERINANAEAHYCLDENTTVAELVQAISDHLSTRTQAARLTHPQTLQQALAGSFPCAD